MLKLVQETSVGGMPQAIVSDLMDPGGQDVLEEAADELAGVQGHGLPG
jgi:hypothetical protein